MRVSRRGFTSVSALLCFCLSAISQDRDRDGGRDNEPHRLVARVQDDLMRAERTTRARGRERDRYECAKALGRLRSGPEQEAVRQWAAGYGDR